MLRRNCALATIAFALTMLASTDAEATAQRTFVASTGSDSNPCNIAQPCRGFARAITLALVEVNARRRVLCSGWLSQRGHSGECD
jgi:hypothetical protein